MPEYRSTIPHVCRHCGITFFPHRTVPGIYCSTRCRGDAYRRPLLSRLWDHSTIDGECWVWHGSRLRNRYHVLTYGQIRVNKKGLLVHQASWIEHNGSIQEGMKILHHCDNPPCWNPDHLFEGTLTDNMQDALAKGRLRFPNKRGEDHGQAQLTLDQVQQIKTLQHTGMRTIDIAHMLDQPYHRVWQIMRGRTWKHLD